MTELMVEKPGIHTTIQDSGRSGFAYYGIPRSGALDQWAFIAANQIVGNRTNEPVLECWIKPPTIRFLTHATIAITGSKMTWLLDDQFCPMHQRISVKAGQTLHGRVTNDSRIGYIAIQGVWQVERHLGSTSTYRYARLGSPEIKAEFTIRTAPFSHSKTIEKIEIEYKELNSVRLKPGPEWHFLSTEEKAAFNKTAFEILPQSNRMGLRLKGDRPKNTSQVLNHSVCLVPGMVQMPPDGNPIVVLADGQTTGGYPRIGYISSDQLCRLVQIPPGQKIKFDVKG